MKYGVSSRPPLQVLYTLLSGSFVAGAATDPALLATLPLVFGIMTFCYSGHGVFPAIQASMKEPEKFPQVIPPSHMASLVNEHEGGRGFKAPGYQISQLITP